MAELLSMAMLNTESVSSAKPQSAAQGGAELAEPDQSFAATLAAEVNGNIADNTTTPVSKTRQNSASAAAKSSDPDYQQTPTQLQPNTELTSSEIRLQPELPQPDEFQPLDSETLPVPKQPAEQSHWLTLLEKAKTLQDRLSKTEKSEAEQKIQLKAAIQADAETVAEQEPETLLPLVATQQLKTTITTAQTQATATQAESKAKIELPQVPGLAAEVAESLSAEELNALKLVATQPQSNPTENNLKAAEISQNKETKSQTQGTVQDKSAAQIVMQQVDLQPKTQVSPSKAAADIVIVPVLPEVTEQKAEQRALKIPQDDAPVYRQSMRQSDPQAADKQLKATVHINQTEVLKQQEISRDDASEQGAASAAKAMATADTMMAAVKTAAPVNPAVKPAESAVAELEQKAELTPTTATEPKMTVQAQSAAALVAPAVQQAKTQTTEAKVSTEDVLKQAQATLSASQSEQSGSPSSGESKHQGAADPIFSSVEQQKTSSTALHETPSFASQLKSSLEKAATGISVSGRELVSEQKQVDPLGQKLNLIQPEASNQLKERMLMMVKDKVHTAEIRLDPSELGSMQIKINLQQDQMSVQFLVQQGNAKELMEQQMPKLKELLQQQGIELSQGSVQQQSQSSSGQEGGRRTAAGNSRGTAADAADELAESAVLPTKNSDRVVDYYA